MVIVIKDPDTIMITGDAKDCIQNLLSSTLSIVIPINQIDLNN